MVHHSRVCLLYIPVETEDGIIKRSSQYYKNIGHTLFTEAPYLSYNILKPSWDFFVYRGSVEIMMFTVLGFVRFNPDTGVNGINVIKYVWKPSEI